MILIAAVQTGGILTIIFVVGLYGFGIRQSDFEEFFHQNTWVGWVVLFVVFSGCLFLVERTNYMSRSAYQQKVDDALSRMTDREAKREADRRFKAGERKQGKGR